MCVYLDFNSSAPVDSRVLEYMVDVYSNAFGNADSRTHDFGEKARKIVEKAREEVASLLQIDNDEVIFTSGATESNNIAIQGLAEYAKNKKKNHIITSAIEHKSVLETVKMLEKRGFDVSYVYPNRTGYVDPKGIAAHIREDTFLVSVMHVNNETGIIQPVKEIGEYLFDKDILFHVDATQSFGKLVDELVEIKYNMLSMSAHKIGGPQGVGALILRKKRYKYPPVVGVYFGGQQEHKIRPGTIPVALVAGLGKACEISKKEYDNNRKKCLEIRNVLVDLLDKSGLTYEINGEINALMPNTINITIEGVSSEALMIASRSYCGVSNGSACNSDSYEPSYVLQAMQIPVDKIDNSIRISWGPDLDMNSTTESFEKLLNVAKKLII